MIVFLGFAATVMAGLSIRVEPMQVIAGEPATLCLINTDEALPQLAVLPQIPNLEWLARTPDVRKSFSSINGDSHAEVVAAYAFIVNKPGEIKLPKLSILVGGKKFTAEPCKFVVRERKYEVSGRDGEATEMRLDDLIFQRVASTADRKAFYIGEEIPLDVKIYISTSLKFNLSNWPRLEVDKVVFKDFSSVNPKNRNFAPFVRQAETLDGREYMTITFSTAFRAITAGMVSGRVTTDGEVIVRDNETRRSRDDFFGVMMMGGNYRSIPRKMTTAIPEIKIEPLPPTSPGETFVGLVGTWRLLASLSADKSRVGEALTLRIKFSGIGSLENLIPPKLDLPGFRVYPPEIERHYDADTNRNNGEIRYTLIPLEEGAATIDLNLAYFDSVSGKYHPVKFKQTVAVAKADRQTSVDNVFVGATAPGGSESVSATAAKTNKNSAADHVAILALKKHADGTVELPLWQNNWYWLVFFLLAGPLFWLWREISYRRQQRLAVDPLRQRRSSALARRAVVIRAVKTASPDDLDEVIRTEVVPCFNDVMGLPPGTDGSGLADKVKDVELATALRHANESGYMPGAAGGDKEKLRQVVLRSLKRLGMVLLLLAGLGGQAATLPTDNNAAMTAYDRGNYHAAAAYYATRIDPHAPDPAWLYNLGNCFCRNKDFARALVCYERAWRLAPGDSDIIENLNFVHRKFFLPEIGRADHPIAWLKAGRDRLRPDQWILFGAVGWLFFWLALAWRRQLRRSLWLVVVPTLIIMLWSAAAAIWQYAGPYSSDAGAIVIGARPQVMLLPADSAEPADFRLHSGQLVSILETRSGWARIKVDGNGEGWVKDDVLVSCWGDDSIRDWTAMVKR